MAKSIAKNLLQKMRYIEWLSTLPELSRADLAVAIKIVSAFNPGRGFAWPSIPTIAADIGCTKRQVIYSVQRLERARLIAVNRSIGRGHANEYIPRFDLMPEDGAYPAVKGEGLCTFPDSAPLVTENREKVKCSAEKVKCSVIKGEAQCTPTELVTELYNQNRSAAAASISIDAPIIENENSDKEIAKLLAQTERAITEKRLNAEQREATLDRLDEIAAGYKYADPLFGWAMRLSEMIDAQDEEP